MPHSMLETGKFENGLQVPTMWKEIRHFAKSINDYDVRTFTKLT